MRNEDDAEDVVQDASIAVFKADTVPRNFRAYLMSATITSALQAKRSQTKTLSLDALMEGADPLIDTLVYEAPGPEQTALDKHLSEALQLALLALLPAQRSLFLSYVSGVGPSDGAYSAKIFRIRKRLRSLLLK